MVFLKEPEKRTLYGSKTAAWNDFAAPEEQIGSAKRIVGALIHTLRCYVSRIGRCIWLNSNFALERKECKLRFRTFDVVLRKVGNRDKDDLRFVSGSL